MKKLFTLALVVLICFKMNAQFNYPGVKQPMFKVEGIDKTFKQYISKLKPRSFTESYFLNMAFANQPFAKDNNSGPFIISFVNLNTKYTNDNFYTLTDLLQFVGKNGELYDIVGLDANHKYVYRTIDLNSTTIKIDSLMVPFAYTRKVNTSDSVVFSIYNLNDVTIPNKTYNSNGSPAMIAYNAAPLYKYVMKINGPIATTDTFNFSSGDFPFTMLTLKPNLSLPTGKGFAFRVQFTGDTANKFNAIFDGYDECNGACVGSEAQIENTSGFINLKFKSTPPFDASGALNRQLIFSCNDPKDCGYTQPQSLRANYFVTSLTNFNVRIDPLTKTIGCSNETFSLVSSYSGLDTLKTVKFTWRSIGGAKFDNGLDTIEGSTANLILDTANGFKFAILTGYASNGEVARDTVNLINMTFNPKLTIAGDLSCDTSSRATISINSIADIGMNSSLLNVYDNTTNLNLATSKKDFDGFFRVTYSWTGPGIVSRADTSFITVNKPGNYVLNIGNVFCSSSKTVFIKTNVVPPTLDFTFTPATACPNEEVTFTVSPSSIKSGWSLLWKDNTTDIGAVNPLKHKFTTSGIKKVYLYADSSGCTATPVFKNFTVKAASQCGNTVSIQDASNKLAKIYPNPVKNGEINIESYQTGKMDVRIIDILGKEIQSKELKNSSSKLDVSNLTNGVYFVELETKQGKQIEKIIIDK